MNLIKSLGHRCFMEWNNMNGNMSGNIITIAMFGLNSGFKMCVNLRNFNEIQMKKIGLKNKIIQISKKT